MIIVPSLIRAGAETQAVDLANGLSEIGHEIHLCSFEPQTDQRNRLVDAVQFHHVRRKKKYDYSLIARVASVIDGENIEVVHGVLHIAALVAWRAAAVSRRNPPVVAAIHTTTNRGMKQEIQERIVYRRILRRLAAVVFVCEYQRRHWIAKYPELKQRSQVVYNGIDARRFRREDYIAAARRLRTELGIPEQAFVFACIAAFRPEKGHRLLIQAFARIANDCYLICAGDGRERAAVEALVGRANLSDRVRFLGNIPDVRPLIVAANSTVLASTAVETFSMAMLESMALEVPVIAPRIGGLAEAIAEGETGCLFPIGDESAMIRCMKTLLLSPERAHDMGRAAGSIVRSAFTLGEMVAASAEVLEIAIRSNGRPAAN